MRQVALPEGRVWTQMHTRWAACEDTGGAGGGVFRSQGPGRRGGAGWVSLRALLSAPDLQAGRWGFHCFSAWSVELPSRQLQGSNSNSI